MVDKQVMKAVTLRIPEEDWKKAKKMLIDDNLTFQDILKEAFYEYLAKKEKEKKEK